MTLRDYPVRLGASLELQELLQDSLLSRPLPLLLLMGKGTGRGGVRTPNLRTDKFYIEVRQKFLREDTSHKVLQLVGNDQHRIERWVINMLATPSGPTKVLQVLYEDGSALELLKLLVSIEEQAPGARDFVALRDEKVHCLERLDNSDNRYYTGDLRKRNGTITAQLGRVILTKEGKMQLFLNGNGSLEIALRTVIAKDWIEKLVRLEQDEKTLHDRYNKKLEEERNRCTQTFNDQVTHMVDLGVPESSARAELRATAKPLYSGLLKPVGLKSGVDAVLLDRGKMSEEDAKLCALNREDEVSMGKNQLKHSRSTVKCVAKEGTRILHSRMEDMRFQALRLMKNDASMSAFRAHKIVGEQCEKDKTFVFKNEAGEEESAAEHARCYFNKSYDKEIFRLESGGQNAGADARPMIAAPPPDPSLPLAGSSASLAGAAEFSASSGGVDGSSTSVGGAKRRRALSVECGNSCLAGTSSSSAYPSPSLLRTQKKPRQGNPPPKEVEWTPYIVVDESDWPHKEPTFINLAKYLASDIGAQWRNEHQIAHVANAQELVDWYGMCLAHWCLCFAHNYYPIMRDPQVPGRQCAPAEMAEHQMQTQIWRTGLLAFLL